MKAREHTYGKDEIIFREGEPGEAVFILVSGRVELTKEGAAGPVPLAVLGANEIFGEMSAIDGRMRGVTARAVDKTTCQIVAKDDFLAWLQQDPEATARIMRVLVERLRNADSIIAHRYEPVGLSSSLFAWRPLDIVRGWLRRHRVRNSPDVVVVEGAPPVKPFQIGIAVLNNDVDNGWSRALADFLSQAPEIVARVVNTSLQLNRAADQSTVNGALVRARQLLAHEAPLDLLIWGDISADGYLLWLSSSASLDDERPGLFGLILR